MNDEESAKLLQLYNITDEETEEEARERKIDLHWRVQMKIMGGGWHPDRGPEPEWHKRRRERTKRLAELHPMHITTPEQAAEREALIREIVAEAAAAQQKYGLLKNSPGLAQEQIWDDEEAELRAFERRELTDEEVEACENRSACPADYADPEEEK